MNDSLKWAELYNNISKCLTKKEINAAFAEYGIFTTTEPTTTKNTSDLYFQFSDKSRIQFQKREIKLWTSLEVSEEKQFEGFRCDDVSDSSYRIKRIGFDNNVENFALVLDYFVGKGLTNYVNVNRRFNIKNAEKMMMQSETIV